MVTRSGHVIELNDGAAVSLRGIIAIVDSAEMKYGRDATWGRHEPCTTIIMEGGHQINVTREVGTLARQAWKDFAQRQER